MHVLGRRLTTALATTGALLATAVLAAPAAEARPTSLNICKLLSSSQVASLHIATACTQKATRTTYAKGITATWGQPQRGKIFLAVYHVPNPAYIKLYESQNTKGKSAGIGDWSRATGSRSGLYSVVVFIVGSYAAELSVSTATDHPVMSLKPVIAMAKSVAGRLK